MILDKHFDFASGQSLSGTSDTVSENVYDAGEAKKIFETALQGVKLGVYVNAIGGTSPTFRARLVGADNQALSTNPITIADTGVRAIASGDLPVMLELAAKLQRTPKRFYGVIFTLGGTSPTATVNVQGGMDLQSHHLH